MTEAELVRHGPALIARLQAAAAAGEIPADRANAAVGQLHALREEWPQAVRALRSVRNPDRAARMYLALAAARLEGIDARKAALGVVAHGLDGGLLAYEDVLEHSDSVRSEPAPQEQQRDWPRSAQHLRAGRFHAAARAIAREALPGALPSRHAQALRLRNRTVPAWDGSPVDRLVVGFEFGLGDQLLFSRYLSALRAKARHVAVMCTARLVDLIRPASPDVDVLPYAGAIEALQRADAFAKPEQLPHYSGEGYGRAAWLQRPVLPASSAVRRVGICWRGTPKNGHDSLRSIPVAELAPLWALPGIEWHSLQLGPAVAEVPPGVLDRSAELGTIEQCARVCASMDMILSCDSMLANLAGSMGMPVWALVEHDNDFRWAEEGDNTPWFPSARVFRQAPAEGWSPVVARVASALQLSMEAACET
jgi:hypothetical protein